MKIKMYGRTPDGEVVREGAEIFEGENALEIVQAMMAPHLASGQSETAFMRARLAKIGESGYKRPSAPIPACAVFLPFCGIAVRQKMSVFRNR